MFWRSVRWKRLLLLGWARWACRWQEILSRKAPLSGGAIPARKRSKPYARRGRVAEAVADAAADADVSLVMVVNAAPSRRCPRMPLSA